MKRLTLLIIAFVLASIGLLLFFLLPWKAEKKERDYQNLEKMKYGKPLIRMIKTFESGGVFYELNPQVFAWHPKNFESDHFVLLPRPQQAPVQIAWNAELFDHFAKTRERFHDSFASGQVLNPLDDALFPWNSFFLDEDEDDEEED